MDRDFRSLVAWLFNFLNGIAVLAGACFLGWLWLQLGGENPYRHAVGTALLLAAVLFVLNVLRLLYFRRSGGENDDYIMSQGGAGGGVRVAIEAIRNELKAAAEELPEVTRCRVSIVRPGPKRVKIHAAYNAREGSNILEISDKLRKVLRERFQEMVPLGEGARVEVEIVFESFAGKAPKKGGEEEEKRPEPPPFTGPRYPVDEDS